MHKILRSIGFVASSLKNTDRPPSASSEHALKSSGADRFPARETESTQALSGHSNLTAPRTLHSSSQNEQLLHLNLKRVQVWVCKEFSEKAQESADLQLRLLEVP